MTEQPRLRRTAGMLSTLWDRAPWFGSFAGDASSPDRSGLRSGIQGTFKDLFNTSTLAATFVVVSAVYCFGIGRDRYQSTSEFVIKQPLPPATEEWLAAHCIAPEISPTRHACSTFNFMGAEGRQVAAVLFPPVDPFADAAREAGPAAGGMT